LDREILLKIQIPAENSEEKCCCVFAGESETGKADFYLYGLGIFYRGGVCSLFPLKRS
jgi:hypothetical protein